MGVAFTIYLSFLCQSDSTTESFKPLISQMLSSTYVYPCTSLFLCILFRQSASLHEPFLVPLGILMESVPYSATMPGDRPTFLGPLGSIPMYDLSGSKHVDPTTNSEPLPARPRGRSTLEKTYSRWCCGSIIGVLAWIVFAFLIITVPIVIVALKKPVGQRCSVPFLRPFGLIFDGTWTRRGFILAD